MKKNFMEQLTYVFFILPFTFIFLIFLGFPFVYAFFLSFMKVTKLFDVLSGLEFIGLENYRILFQDPSFFWGIIASIIYGLIGIPLGLFVSLSLALLLRRKTRINSLYRTLFFLPFVLDPFVVGIVWTFVYAPQYGIIPQILNFLRIASIDFGILSDPKTAMLGVVIAMTLKNAGLGMILFIAALDDIPPEVLEAADIDNAIGWKRVVYIIIPLLRPVVLFLIVIGIIGALSAFAEFYAMTGGGPSSTFLGNTVGSTRVAGLYLFDHFQNLKLGLASATSFVLLIISVGFSYLSFKLIRSSS